MKQHLFSFFKAVVSVACVSLFLAGCTANNPDSLDDGDDPIEVVTIESLNVQVKDINRSLNEYKSTMNQLSSFMVELQDKVNALDGQGYTDLKSKVDALEGKVTAFENALKDLDGFTDLNTWVSNLNDGLNSLNTLQGAVNEAKTSITNITTRLNGLDQTTANIASELNTKTKQLTDNLSKCSTDISGMMNRLAALEDCVGTLQKEIAALISAVQSVVVVPDYADGSVKMTDRQDNVLRFEVYPTTAAQKLAEVGPSAFSLDCVETETKASSLINIPITSVSFDGEFLSVTADGSGLKDSIKDGTQPANARLRITDGKMTRSSEYFALTYKTSSGEPILDGNSVTVGSEYVSAGKEKLMGKALFTEADGYVEYGFALATSATQLIATPTLFYADKTDDGVNYSVTIGGLISNTTYYYRSFLSKGGILYYGETKSFTTNIYVSSIVLDKESLTLVEEEAASVSVVSILPEDAFDKTITWSSSKPSVATVDPSGRVTAISAGTADIIASANDGFLRAICSIQVLSKYVTLSLCLPNTKSSWENGRLVFDPNEKIIVNDQAYDYQIYDGDHALVNALRSHQGYQVFYPARCWENMNLSQIEANFESTSNSEADILAYTYLTDDAGGPASLETLNALLCFQISNAQIASHFKLSSASPLSGKYKYDLNNYVYSGDAGEWISTAYEINVTITDREDYYICLPPCLLEDLRLVIYDSNGEELQNKYRSSPLTIHRNTLNNLRVNLGD